MKKLLYCLTFFTVSALSVFASDLFPFQSKGKYGFINQSGKVVVEPSFNFAEKFSEGMGLVKKNGKVGFINDQGKLLPRRLTGTSLKFQRKVAQAVKRARHIGLLPYVTDSLK